MSRSPTEMDAFVGERVRQRRKQMGLSQASFAEALGIAVPQVQKYEKGTNRIGASRLHSMARVLGVPVGYLFGETDSPLARPSEGPDPSLFADREVIELALAFRSIASPVVRHALLDLARAVGLGASSPEQVISRA